MHERRHRRKCPVCFLNKFSLWNLSKPVIRSGLFITVCIIVLIYDIIFIKELRILFCYLVAIFL